jgi:hypothetical protein
VNCCEEWKAVPEYVNLVDRSRHPSLEVVMIRLNLGSADRYVDGWVNVDHAACPHRKDVAVDLTGELPWSAWSVTEIYAGHVLEHLTFDDASALLNRLRFCMIPGGVIMVVGPDVDKAKEMIEVGTFDYTYHSLDTIRFGDDRWPGTKHQWDCTAELVAALLTISGWEDVTEVGIENVDAHWPVIDRAQLWQCAVRGVAP